MYYYLLLFIFFFVSSAEAQLNNSCNKAINPSKVIAVGGSITEILYFLNLEKYIIGIDVTSNFPKETKNITSVGYVRNISSEGILSLNPSLIIAEDDMGPIGTIKQLNESKVDFRIVEETESAYGILEKIYCIASIMGQNENAKKIINEKLLNQIKELEEIKNQKILKNKKFMLVLSMQPSSIIVAGKNTSGDNFIKMMGAKNIFDSFDGWKSVNKEAILKENPDYVLIPSKNLHKNSKVEDFSKDIMFLNTNAGKNGNFIFEDGMTMLGFGPRTIDSALKIAKKINLED